MIIMVISFLPCYAQHSPTGISIPIEKYKLDNGLTVVLNVDKSDPIVATAIYYHVGSSREVRGKTGFAHLFEHMMFQRSENIGEDQLFKMVQGAGGTLNGSTGEDVTNYYEVVPKNALEMVLWIESDRMGYLTNTVTRSALTNQQNVVQNEKRQSVDNAAYGFNSAIIAKNLFPSGHPYSWTVIGDMDDLTNASVEDVIAFHNKYYVPNNATLVISGDFDKKAIKALVSKYFGEIPIGGKIELRSAMPVTLSSTQKLYHEDNFAKVPQLTMVFPTVEQFSKDSYALDFLGGLLANTKKAPLYTILVKDKRLTSRVMARNRSQELTGSFRISVIANPGVNLTEVEKAIFEGFDKFEKDGFTEDDLTQIKAKYETRFYNAFESVQGKGFQLAEYTVFTGDPEYYKKDFSAAQAVTMDDIKNVYHKYIKGKNFIETSFVPKGKTNLISEGSKNAGIVEEDVVHSAEVKTATTTDEHIVKTPTKFDRSKMPAIGPDPSVKIPQVWTSSLTNGMKVWGIQQRELPLIQYSIVIEGGHMAEDISKAGLANLVASVMNEGTKTKTSEELEEAIGLLGATIRFSASNEAISVEVSTLTKNFEKTITLLQEMLLEPRWDKEEFALAKSRTLNSLKRNQANPTYLASTTLNKLIFGENNILAVETSGTEKSVNSVTIDDLKTFYDTYFSPSNAKLIIAGDIDQTKVKAAFNSLTKNWLPKKVILPALKLPAPPASSAIFFVDVPGAKQSVISIGTPSISRSNPDFYPAYVANYKLGGSFNGVFNLILREEKGYTYGARSSFSGSDKYGTFSATSMVRTNSTLESVSIFKAEMEKYRKSVPQEYIDFTKSALIKGNALRFETLNDLLGMLNSIAIFGLPVDYIMKNELFLKGLTIQKQLDLVNKYIDPSKMYYVVVGDAKTQMNELEKVGLGKPILIK